VLANVWMLFYISPSFRAFTQECCWGTRRGEAACAPGGESLPRHVPDDGLTELPPPPKTDSVRRRQREEVKNEAGYMS